MIKFIYRDSDKVVQDNGSHHIPWKKNDDNLLLSGRLEELRSLMEEGSIIMEHLVYGGAGFSWKIIFDDFGDLIRHVEKNGGAGDHFIFWPFDEVCRDNNAKFFGKLPDADGKTPVGGVY